MKKILFIRNYRAGTNLWDFVNGQKEVNFYASLKTKDMVNGKPLSNPDVELGPGDRIMKNGWVSPERCYWLPTVPAQICPTQNYWVSNIDATLATNPPFEYFSWRTSIGDWWGDVPDHTYVPEPYDVVTPVRYGPAELCALPGKQSDWRFIYIMRDGRNQIESLRNIPGGIEQEKHNKDAVDYFQVLSKAFRNRARLALDCEATMGNFKMFRFEDFASDCVGTMTEIYKFCGLEADQAFIQRAFDLTKKNKIQRQHSSFGSGTKVHQRWHTWTDWEKETFANIAGKEMAELGYV